VFGARPVFHRHAPFLKKARDLKKLFTGVLCAEVNMPHVVDSKCDTSKQAVLWKLDGGFWLGIRSLEIVGAGLADIRFPIILLAVPRERWHGFSGGFKKVVACVCSRPELKIVVPL